VVDLTPIPHVVQSHNVHTIMTAMIIEPQRANSDSNDRRGYLPESTTTAGWQDIRSELVKLGLRSHGRVWKL
jgi:hypothetical protein